MLLTTLLFCSCSQNLEKAGKATDYTKSIKQKTVDKIHASLKTDIDFLERLLETENDLLCLSFGIKFSSFGDNEKEVSEKHTDEAHIVPEKPYRLDFDMERERKSFEAFPRYAAFLQHFALPKSSFHIYANMPDTLSHKGSLSHEIKKCYRNGEEIEPDAVNLLSVDSIRVETTLNVPLAFETFRIPRNAGNSIRYGEYTIKIDSIDGHMAKIEIPAELYERLLSYHGITPGGKLMGNTSKKEYPEYGISSELLSHIRNLKAILANCLQEREKENIMRLIEGVTQEEIEAKSQLSAYLKETEKLEEADSFEQMKKIIEKGIENGYLETKGQCIEAEFPYKISGIALYIATRVETMKTESVIRQFIDPEQKNHVAFTGENQCKGIADRNGNILIPAAYNTLYFRGANYVATIEDDDYTHFKYYWIDINKRCLRPIKDMEVHYSIFDGEFAVCSNPAGKKGIIRKNDEVVLPFENKEIHHMGDYILAEKAEDEDSLDAALKVYDRNMQYVAIHINRFDHVYDTYYTDAAGKKHASESDTLIAAEFENGKYGLLNLNAPWKWVIPPQYDRLSPIYNTPSYLMVQNGNESPFRYGVIDLKGNTVLPLDYADLHLIDDINQVFKATKDNGNKSAYGVVDIRNTTLLPFKYADIARVSEKKPEWMYVCIENGEKKLWGVTDISGKTVLPAKYEFLSAYSENTFIFTRNRKYGYISGEGRIIAPAEFREASEFNEGYAFVIAETYYGLIDTKGNFTMKTPFKDDDGHIMYTLEDGEERTYHINGKKYDYKGELIGNEN